jgi:hypothetical protein
MPAATGNSVRPILVASSRFDCFHLFRADSYPISGTSVELGCHMDNYVHLKETACVVAMSSRWHRHFIALSMRRATQQ